MILFWYWWYILQLLNMMCTIIYQDHASCFFSPIQVYELSSLIVCSKKAPILWECSLWWPWQWYMYLIGFTPYHRSPWGSGDISRLLVHVSGIRLPTNTCVHLLMCEVIDFNLHVYFKLCSYYNYKYHCQLGLSCHKSYNLISLDSACSVHIAAIEHQQEVVCVLIWK